MALAWERVRDDAAAERLWNATVRPVAREMASGAAELAERIVARLEAEGHQRPESAFIGFPASVTDVVRQLAEVIDAGADPRAVELPESVVAVGRARIQYGVPLAYVMRTFRLSQDLLWAWLFARITDLGLDAADQAVALELVTSWLFSYVDGALVRSEQIYEREREAWLRSAAAARTSALDDVLAGRERDDQRAATKLRYDVNREHIAVCIWLESPDEDTDTETELAKAVAAVETAVGSETALTHPTGPLALTAWLSRREPFDAAALGTDAILRSSKRPAAVRVAMGEPAWGLAGFRRSHLQAEQARRVAELAGSRSHAVTRYRDVALAALASADPGQATEFVLRVLGPLAADDETTYRVAMTLAAYLQENRSPARAARRLTVHPNTVTYRVNQAESILGRSVDSDAAEVTVALALLPLLPGLSRQG